MLLSSWTSLLLLPILAAATSLTDHNVRRNATTGCNNSPDLCYKSYGQITHLGAHDSPFLRDATTGFTASGNQFYNTTVQLNYGVRLITAQVHKDGSEWHLCHSSCKLLDAGKFSDWLSEVKQWMDDNPNEVVTLLIVNSDNAPAKELDSQFKAANLLSLVYTPDNANAPPATWPTLQQLISQGTRLMVFVATVAEPSPTVPYLMDEFTFIFENPYEVTSPSNFSCQPDRPSGVQNNAKAAISSKRLPLVNHFLGREDGLGIVSPNVDLINSTNSPTKGVGTLGQAAADCTTAYGRKPAFLLVDYADQGPAINVVDSLNGVTNPIGRTPLPNSNSEALESSGASTNRNGYMFRGLADMVMVAKSGSNPSKGNWIWVGGDWGSLLGGGLDVF